MEWAAPGRARLRAPRGCVQAGRYGTAGSAGRGNAQVGVGARVLLCCGCCTTRGLGLAGCPARQALPPRPRSPASALLSQKTHARTCREPPRTTPRYGKRACGGGGWGGAAEAGAAVCCCPLVLLTCTTCGWLMVAVIAPSSSAARRLLVSTFWWRWLPCPPPDRPLLLPLLPEHGTNSSSCSRTCAATRAHWGFGGLKTLF